MELAAGWQDALFDEIRRATEADPRIVAVRACGSVAAGSASDWSDLDVAVRVQGHAAGEIASAAWLSQFGPVWATDASASSVRSVVRAVYADGRRLDLSVAAAGPARVAQPPALSRLAARTTRVRFTAAMAVVRAARGDALLAAHLALGFGRDCLELAVQIRDRALANNHGLGDAGAQAAQRVAVLLAGAGDRQGCYPAIEGLAALYDELAATVDSSYAADWSGLASLLAKARHALATPV
ncbi:MAG: hypothetical protein JWO79_2159 [Actinomycetia bacterium]|nr:hypothetical protein [Actinomycetes bacterium]